MSRSNNSFTSSFIASTSARRYNFRSTATWSFLLLPLCIFLPASPMRRVRRYSTWECTSSIPSSIANFPVSTSFNISSSPLTASTASCSFISPTSFSIFTWAIDPCTSYCASNRSNSLSLPTVNFSISSFTEELSFCQSFMFVSWRFQDTGFRLQVAGHFNFLSRTQFMSRETPVSHLQKLKCVRFKMNISGFC